MIEPSAKPKKFSFNSKKLVFDNNGSTSLRGILSKIIFLGLADAGAVFVGFLLFAQQEWAFFWGLTGLTVLINFIYLRKGGLPAKYLAPGVILLTFFQIYVVAFSGYIAFTNYSTSHNGSKAEAVDALQQSSIVPDENGPFYNLTIAQDSKDKIVFLMSDPATGESFIGGEDPRAYPLQSATLNLDDLGFPIVEPPFKPVAAEFISSHQNEITQIRIPAGPDSENGFFATQDAATAQLFHLDLIWNEADQTFTRVSDGVIFKESKEGFFAANQEGVEPLPTGWRVEVGLKNFETIFTSENLRAPILKILTWTFIFAIVSVLSTFILGLALALFFNDERLKGQKLYRSLIILPYAFPAFLSAYVWKGLFDTDNGFINQVIFGGTQIPWLDEELTARIAILVVNLWLGFPYMFLISTGALQAIPAELMESAKLDGASNWQAFRLIKLPLLLVSLAPLLISSFAFNFNNFTLIYLLTGGGPSSGDASLSVDPGGTDILITFVYKIAFASSSGRDYGLASAFSILIFLIVGTLSYIGFRRTKSLEEIN